MDHLEVNEREDSSGERGAKAQGEDSRVLSGGTGEASQETISRHFQKVMGLSPITKLESEGISQFTISNLAMMRQDQTVSTFREDNPTKNSNLLPQQSIQSINYQNGTMMVNSARSNQKHLSRLSDRRTKQNQLESYQSNASGGILTHMSSVESSVHSSVIVAPSARQTHQVLYTQDSIQEVIDDDDDPNQNRQEHLPFLLPNRLERYSQPSMVEIDDQSVVSISVVSILGQTENSHQSKGIQDSGQKSSRDAGLGSELKTQCGFYRAQTHEKTSDLTMLDKIVYEKRNLNKLVEDELEEFRREIEGKFAISQSQGYVMPRIEEQKYQATTPDLLLMPDQIGQTYSRITLHHDDVEDEVGEYGGEDVESDGNQKSTQISHKSSLVVLNDALNQGPTLCFDMMAQRAEGMKLVGSSGATSNQKSGIASPVSLNMDLICQDGKLPEEHQTSPPEGSTSKKKEDQLRKFAKQIINRHVNQAQEFTSGGKNIKGSALSKLLEGLVKQQKKQGHQKPSTKKPSSKKTEDFMQIKKVHQKSTNLTNTHIHLAKTQDQKRSKSNPRAPTFISADSHSGNTTGKGGFQTLQDNKNNTLISLAQKRRRAGIATRQEPRRSSRSNIARRDLSGEKSRSISRGKNAMKQSSQVVGMTSPAHMNQIVKVMNSASGAEVVIDPSAEQLMLTSMLTKSLGIPPTAQLNKGVGKKTTRDGLFKILKDFEEQLETGYHVDRNLNRSVSVKRDRSHGTKSKQSKHHQGQPNDIYRASSVPRSSVQKQSQKMKVSSSRGKQSSFIIVQEMSGNLYNDQELNHISPILQSKSHHGKHLKNLEIKQLSTASESLLVYDIARPQGNKQQPMTVKNSQSFTSQGGSSKIPGHAANIRVKTPNELGSSKGPGIKNSGGSGNRANLFNKYLRATDISNQKRISYQKLQSSRSKRKESIGNKAAVKRQSNRTGDSLGSVRNSSLTSQRVYQGSTTLAAGSANIISGTGVCKYPTTTTSHKSKSSRGTKQSSINDPMRVYQTYIGPTTARLSGFNRRTQLSRQGRTSIEGGEEQKTQLSFQKNSVSSSITNKMIKPGLKDPKDQFQLTVNSSTKTPSANVILNGLIMNSRSVQKMSQGPRGQTSQSSHQKLLDSSMNYPQSSGIPFVDGSWKKPGTGQEGGGNASQSTKINILSKIKVNRQSNTSLAVGPNQAPGLIIGNNTVKILKPTQSQQKLNNVLQKTSSFENQFTHKSNPGAISKANALLQQCTTGAGIKIKSSDIIRADLLTKSNQSQLTKHSKKQLYQHLITQKLSQGLTPSAQNAHTSLVTMEKRSNTELMHKLPLNSTNSRHASQKPNSSKMIANNQQPGLVEDNFLMIASNPNILQADQHHHHHTVKQAQTTKHIHSTMPSHKSSTAYNSSTGQTLPSQIQIQMIHNAAASSAINIKKPLQNNLLSRYDQYTGSGAQVGGKGGTQTSSTKKQKSSAQKLNTSRMVLLKPSASNLIKQSAMMATTSIINNNSTVSNTKQIKQQMLSSRGAAKRSNDLNNNIVANTYLATSTQPTHLTQPLLNAQQKSTTLKRAISKGNSRSSTAERANQKPQLPQGNTAVLLDIDQLVRTSAAAAFLQKNITKGGQNNNQQTAKRQQSQQASRNHMVNLKQSTAGSSNGPQQIPAQPLIGKKKLVAHPSHLPMNHASNNLAGFTPNATVQVLQQQQSSGVDVAQQQQSQASEQLAKLLKATSFVNNGGQNNNQHHPVAQQMQQIIPSQSSQRGRKQQQ